MSMMCASERSACSARNARRRLRRVSQPSEEVAGGSEQHELVDSRIDALHEVGDALEQRDAVLEKQHCRDRRAPTLRRSR